MAAAEKIKALLQSYGDEDDSRFYTTAMQIAAAEAKKGHIKGNMFSSKLEYSFSF